MIVYKIRRKSDGLFSTGGTYPSFTNKGKTWSGLGQVKNHLNQFIFTDYKKNLIYANYPYYDCELVEFVISQTESKTDDLKKMINEALDRQGNKMYHKINNYSVKHVYYKEVDKLS